MTKNYDIITSDGQTMSLIWNLIKAFADTEDDNKKDNKDLEDWQKELVKENIKMQKILHSEISLILQKKY